MHLKSLEDFLSKRKRRVIPINGYKPAASLVPLAINEKIFLLITKRAAHLKNHPGQFSFPGGHIEKNEQPLKAALREAEEEVGISQKDIRIIGALDDVVSVTNFHLTPFVGVVPYSEHYDFDKNEVECVHLIPLSFFLNEPKTANYYWQGEAKPSFVYDYKDMRIFGVTAYVIKNFVEILKKSGFINANRPLI